MVPRRLFALFGPVVAALVLAAGVWGVGTVDQAGEPEPVLGFRPNIVLISTDDQTLEEMRWLPKTRALLGDRGVTFNNFVAPHPLCCPSRAQLLTGQYAQNNGVRGNSGPYGGYTRFTPESALPVWLQDAGYRTAFVGKYLNLYSPGAGTEPGWDVWNPTVKQVYQYRGYTQLDRGQLVQPPGYHTTYVADQSTEIVEELAAEDEPFFLWSSYVAPHSVCRTTEEEGVCPEPPRPAAKYADRFGDVRAPFLSSPSFNEPDLRDKPWVVTKRGPVDAAQQQRLYVERVRALASVDDAVESIVAALERSGELDETLIVFTSDNGYLFGEHTASGKVLAYEESLRVPLLMRGPGAPPGVFRDQTVAMIDLAPTFAELAGASPDLELDGTSLLPWLKGEAQRRDRTLLVQAGPKGADEAGLGWWYRGVRTDRYTYLVWAKTGKRELYDRRTDPFQLVNVANNSAYAEVVTELQRRGSLLVECSGSSCEEDFGPVPEPAPSVVP